MVVLVGCLALIVGAEESTEQAAPMPTSLARLLVENRHVATVPVTFAPAGPMFAISPIAAALGVELRVGPLGDSHTLIYADRQFLIGPGQALMVVVAPDGRTQKAITRLRQVPIRDAAGLKVSLETLEEAFGEPLNQRFGWRGDVNSLEVARRDLRLLDSSINLVHQYQVSLVEIEFSEEPRYRIERPPGALEIHFEGDRLNAPSVPPSGNDPLVRRIFAAEDRLRLELASNAVAAEPRLLLDPARLVVEVFEGVSSSPTTTENRPRRRTERAAGVRTIVLDPGHGGSETGAIGPAGSAEAPLTLLVARALKFQLERRLPVKVILTREEDVDVPLETRSAIANQNRADLFISLHFNASFGSQAHGAETYFLSREASDQMAAELAAKENQFAASNASSELDLQMILWDLAQSYHLAESQRFANLVQEELNVSLGLRDRGVKQAPFHVLMGAKMPAVLVELGFLSNPAEEAELQRPAYRAKLVDALVRAISRFKRQVEDSAVADRGPASGGRGEAGTRDP